MERLIIVSSDAEKVKATEVGDGVGGKRGTTSKYLEQLDNLSENKINHIINGSKNSNHGWKKLVSDKN